MTRGVLLYEDAHVDALSPVADCVPVMGLRFGASTLGERLVRAAGGPLIAVEARASVLAAWRERPSFAALAPSATDEILVLNAAALPGAWLAEARDGSGPALFRSGGRIAGARVPFAKLQPGIATGAGFEVFLAALGLEERGVDATHLAWPWQLMQHNAAAIAADLPPRADGILGEVHPQAAIHAGERVTVAKSARVDAFAVLDARSGPIVLGDDVVVEPYTRVVGPCAVGRGTQLLGGVIARSTFGPECRIAGEVEECVWQGWSNKRHHGFVGHSVIGAWVNLGALTTTSDLKNNYGPVRVWAQGALRDSGSPKVGAMIGDHVKTGIGTLLPGGASIGPGANLFGGGRWTPKRVAPFAWWDGERCEEHRLAEFVATARTAMSRRGVALGEAELRVLEAAHAGGAAERATMAS